MDDLGIEPVYLLKDRHIPAVTQETGANNLIVARGLKHAYHKFCQKKLKETLSDFLPDLPGVQNTPAESGTGIRALIEGPQPIAKPLEYLTANQMESFRLQSSNVGATALPEKLVEELHTAPRRKRKKDKSSKDKSKDPKKKKEKKDKKDKKKDKREIS
ncbi:Oidioi.mRNA.OKI2018_I69.PAR.g12547.t1.cds [Oikopleura dioica]|uniref:Mediator of RNA polymerase II transcription subunit 19 n=1 Tax=Oikopleura dioica TaxID=34765 RepID=A0ABN7S111_OIKDI|nr:Oidioi.mRNA.OKI2018_I69.PAR.g12547.t1.cds [Oikopleura dioica]